MFRPLLLLTVMFAGCSVGEVPIGGGGTTDGGTALCAERLVPPPPQHDHLDGTGTRAGTGCVIAGCHLTGGAGPTFVMAGTLYKPGGAQPAAGALIRLVPDGGGNAVTATTDAAGNFHAAPGATQPFPGKAHASGCPTEDAHMVGAIAVAGNGNCNGGTACHANPGNFIMVLADQ
jgi:hypothetical protein